MRVRIFLSALLLLLFANAVLLLVDGSGFFEPGPADSGTAALAESLRLTDLALWTEARYTRHPSQADLFTPFQSGPSMPEHFPSGSWVSPPPGFATGRAERATTRQGGLEP